jgi:hypothetical protein
MRRLKVGKRNIILVQIENNQIMTANEGIWWMSVVIRGHASIIRLVFGHIEELIISFTFLIFICSHHIAICKSDLAVFAADIINVVFLGVKIYMIPKV